MRPGETQHGTALTSHDGRSNEEAGSKTQIKRTIKIKKEGQPMTLFFKALRPQCNVASRAFMFMYSRRRNSALTPAVQSWTFSPAHLDSCLCRISWKQNITKKRLKTTPSFQFRRPWCSTSPYFQTAKLQSHAVADFWGVVLHVITSHLRMKHF